MPAVTADTLTLPRLPELSEQVTDWRGVGRIITAQRFLEGEGFQVRRPFPGVDLALADPFLLLDHMAAAENAPGKPKAPPGPPNRGSRTGPNITAAGSETPAPTAGAGLSPAAPPPS